MEIIYEKNYINKCNELKVIKRVQYMSQEEFDKNKYARLNWCMKKIREKYKNMKKEREELFHLIQYYQLKIIKMLEKGIDEKDYEFRRLKEFVDMKIVELHSLDREIDNMEKKYSKL